MLLHVFMFYCCVTESHKLCTIKHTHLLSPGCCGSEFSYGLVGVPVSVSHKAVALVSTGLQSHLKVRLGKDPFTSCYGYWQD